jgi:hypothetical protein
MLKRTIGDRVVVVSVADDYAPLGEDLLTTLEKLDAKGPPIKEGSRIAYGWSQLTIADNLAERGTLEVQEPDFDGDPMHDTRSGVYDTTDVLFLQGRLCKQLKVEPTAAWFAHGVVLMRGVLDQKKVYLQRQAPSSQQDTGWYIGPVDKKAQPKPEDLETLPVWKIFQQRRNLLEAMALPVGYLAVFNGSYLEAVLDPNNREVLRR